MGLGGLLEYKENLEMVMNSKAFKEADFGKRMNIGVALLNSKYGTGGFLGTRKLKDGNIVKPRVKNPFIINEEE